MSATGLPFWQGIPRGTAERGEHQPRQRSPRLRTQRGEERAQGRIRESIPVADPATVVKRFDLPGTEPDQGEYSSGRGRPDRTLSASNRAACKGAPRYVSGSVLLTSRFFASREDLFATPEHSDIFSDSARSFSSLRSQQRVAVETKLLTPFGCGRQAAMWPLAARPPARAIPHHCAEPPTAQRGFPVWMFTLLC
jgi:hypothetical protein